MAAVVTLAAAAYFSHRRRSGGGNGRLPRRRRPVAGLWRGAGSGGCAGVSTASDGPRRRRQPAVAAAIALQHTTPVERRPQQAAALVGHWREGAAAAVTHRRWPRRPAGGRRVGRRLPTVWPPRQRHRGTAAQSSATAPGTRGICAKVWMQCLVATRPRGRSDGRCRLYPPAPPPPRASPTRVAVGGVALQ